MKRFSIFCAALFAAATSFAAVTYELNGGVINADGWLDKKGMYEGLNADWNAYSGGTKTWKAYEEQLGIGKSNAGIPSSVTGSDDILGFFASETYSAKWGWLPVFLDAKAVEQGKATLPSTAVLQMRFALGNFFGEDNNNTTNYIGAVDGTGANSSIDAFQPYWKSGFANPTEPTAEFVLNAPYKEGDSFLGWYWNADFSGEKVTKIDATSTGTLYAKFGEYIPTIAEVRALADDTEAKTSGVVNFVSGKNVWIQDATGGILVYTSETPACEVGQKITVKGKKVMYGDAPELSGAVIEATEASKLYDIVAYENLAALVADSLEHKYFATRVTVPGVTIVEYDSYNNPTVQDALGNKAKCYKMVLDPAAYPVGCKVTVTGVAAWHYAFQFVGNAADIVRPVVGKVEDYTYPVRHSGRYALKNNWVISNIEDNFAANKPGGTDRVRGMAAKDGIMYFINSINDAASNSETPLLGEIVRVDGKTGDMLTPIKLIGEHLFEVQVTDTTTGETTWKKGVTLAHNDLKFDQAGNCLIGACVSAANSCQAFIIYKVNLETGECEELINDVLWENPGLNGVKFRFDAFGVAGDVTKNGVIMAADANGSWNVYRWLIEDGVAGEGEQVAALLDPAVDQSLFINAAGYGTAPQIFPQDEEGSLFYVDGFNTLPMLFYASSPEAGATLVDDFINVPTGVKVWNTDTISMNQGHNGLVEFQVGEEYFLLMAATNTAGTPASAFALYKFADEYRSFSEMEPLWYFPKNGLGSTTNGCRTAVPSVDVVSDTEATLYIYANNNGYAAYTLTIDPTIISAVEDIEAVKVGAEKVIENGQIFILKNGVKYNALGAQVK